MGLVMGADLAFLFKNKCPRMFAEYAVASTPRRLAAHRESVRNAGGQLGTRVVAKTFLYDNGLTCLSSSDKVTWEQPMPYERSQALEKRLQDLLSLLREGRHSAPTLACKLEVSQPTVARCLAALRKRGYMIRALKGCQGWSYHLSADGLPAAHAEDLP
jgi:biotin operon repressor